MSLVCPLAPLRAAATYAHFVERIEASEHPFHALDVSEQLELAERILEDDGYSGDPGAIPGSGGGVSLSLPR